MVENNMEKPKNKNFANTASRISAIASSVMDLHVRIALQEVDREKRRLISGGIFLAIGSTLLLLVLIFIHIIFYLFLTIFPRWLLLWEVQGYLLFLLFLWEGGKSPLFKLIYFKIRPYFLIWNPYLKICAIYIEEKHIKVYLHFIYLLFSAKRFC